MITKSDLKKMIPPKDYPTLGQWNSENRVRVKLINELIDFIDRRKYSELATVTRLSNEFRMLPERCGEIIYLSQSPRLERRPFKLFKSFSGLSFLFALSLGIFVVLLFGG